MSKSATLERIRNLFYEGIVLPGDWYAGLDQLRMALGAEVFHFLTVDSRQSAVIDSVDNQGSVGLHAQVLRDYEQHYVGSDLRMGVLAAMPVGQIMLDHEHISAREMSRSVVYTDFLGAHGFWNTLGTSLRDEGGSRDYLGFLRAADAQPYSDSERQLMHALLPDLTRASRLRARTRHIARQAAYGMAALDALTQGVAVVDARGRLQFANAAAHAALSQRLLTLRSEHIHCLAAGQSQRLAQLIARACTAQGARSAGSLYLQGDDGAGGASRLVVTVLPLRPGAGLALRDEPMALVVLVNPDSPLAVDAQAISEMLGLSPMETTLAMQLARGNTVKDFAMASGCSWHTARSHLKNLMRKTGCSRQVELVQLLQSLRLG